MFNIFFPRKPCRLSDNVKKYCRARQATRHMRFARCVTKAIHTHPEYVLLIVFHGNNGYVYAP